MYKVFISNRPVTFRSRVGAKVVFKGGCLHFHCTAKSELERILQLIENDEQISEVFVYNNTPEVLFNYLSELCDVIEAAGGVVENEKGEILMIYRRGFWDLPKGKIDPGETREEAAVREVSEECGIPKPEIVRALETTYHTYFLKGKRILKPSYWYLMRSHDQELIPQTEEDIEIAQWTAPSGISELLDAAYPSIRELLLTEKITDDLTTD
jgi:8-oxo-dGTP pyrophosphatase MutT (NUDIX family)